MKYATVVIPFGYTPRWIQIVLSSLKTFKNDRDFNVIVMNNSPETNHIRAVTETEFGEGIEVVTPPEEMRYHGGALDYGIDLIGTEYLFALESDCTVDRDGWLDWYAGFMKDRYVAMAGWFWAASGRNYINSSVTLYNTDIMKRLLEECRNNTDTVISYGRHYEQRMNHDHTARLVTERKLGPFTDSRGFQHSVEPVTKWYHEPGNWVYNRCLCQWECIRVPGAIVKNTEPNQPEYRYNFYGPSDAEAYARHYWGGTVSHNFDKHLIYVQWEANSTKWWLNREYDMWLKYVPERIRRDSIEKKLVRNLDEELAYAAKRTHVVQIAEKVMVYSGNAEPYIMGDLPLDAGDGSPGQVVGWHHEKGMWIVKLESKPKFESPNFWEEGGLMFIYSHPQTMAKRS